MRRPTAARIVRQKTTTTYTQKITFGEMCESGVRDVLLALLTLAMLTGTASAQQRTFYDSRGNVVGRSATDSNGTSTNYDARGKVISRETTSGNTTTIYDAGGRSVGRITTNR